MEFRRGSYATEAQEAGFRPQDSKAMLRQLELLRFGSDSTEAAYRASGCSSMLNFLSSPLCARVRRIIFASYSVLKDLTPDSNESLGFAMTGLRAREGKRDFVRFLHALPTSLPFCTKLDICNGEFASEDELSALLLAIASPHCTLHYLAFTRIQIASDTDHSLTKHIIRDTLLRANTPSTLQSLYYSTHLCSQGDLVEFLTHTASSIKALEIDLTTDAVDDVLQIIVALAENTISLSHLLVKRSNFYRGDLYYSPDAERQLGTMLLTNTTLRSLTLYGLSALSGEVVCELFTSLKDNAQLTSLSLYGCSGPNWPRVTFVLDALRTNGFLSDLNLYGTPLSEYMSDAAIKVNLARNGENEMPMNELRSQGIAKVAPTTARLFLCGLPYSGKTTLSFSLSRWASSSLTIFLSRAKRRKSQRTRGIEVTNLEKDGVNVSLWDLAGQKEYYSFHDFMFPNEPTPSLFLFVWSPIRVDNSGHNIEDRHGTILTKSPDDFKDEFTYWLRFIASKTLKSINFRPRVLIAITRADHHLSNTKSLIGKHFKECEEEFKEYVHLDIGWIYEIDARDPIQVKPLALYIFDCASKVLQSAPLVYKACDDARRLLRELVHTKPIMRKEEFYHLCHQNLGMDSKEVQEAIAFSLNNSGDLIFFRTAELMVIDTQWFCHHVMGNLLHFDMKSNKRIQVQGFFPLECLQELLEKETHTASHKSSTRRGKHAGGSIRHALTKTFSPTSSLNIIGEDLVKLFLGLGLGCQYDDSSAIFIPASLYKTKNGQIYPSQYLKGDKQQVMTYIGRRLNCKDSLCTFFTPGIFHSLQVTFKNVFSDRGVNVVLAKDVISFACDGVEVFVEFCKLGKENHFIDVLVHSHLNLDDTLEWVCEKILDKMEMVCANPRGIQGVQLVRSVIKPSCIKQSICMEERTQVVTIEELKESLRIYLERRGYQLTVKDDLQNVLYTWQQTKDSECVADLLGKVEVLKVIESYKHGLNVVARDVWGVISAEEGTYEINKPNEPIVFSSTQSSKEREAIYNKVCIIEKKVDIVQDKLQDLQNEVEDLRKAVLPKLEKGMRDLLTFAEEGEAGKFPRMFMVTQEDGNMMRKIVAGMVPGLQNVRLELLCERQRQPHFVDGQPGLILATLGDGVLKRGLPYINTFLKIAYIAVQTGAHLAAGLDNSIPDFTKVLNLMPNAPKIPALPTHFEPAADSHAPSTSAASSSLKMVNFQEGQQWLYDVLSKHDCHGDAQIHDIFGLARVRYQNGKVAWLCDKHCSEGTLCRLTL